VLGTLAGVALAVAALLVIVAILGFLL